MAQLPGYQSPTTPPLPNTNPDVAPPALPAWWNQPNFVIARVLEISVYDPKAAGEIWAEYRRLTGS